MTTVIHDEMFSPEVSADPYSYFGRLREEDPIHWNQKYEVWVVTGYDDIVYIMRHPEHFSSAFWKNDPRGAFPPIREEDMNHYRSVANFISKWVIQNDPPEHARIRNAVHGYFTPNAVEKWRPMVKDVVNRLLDELQGKGHMDVMTDFATPLPVMVISRFLGIPEQDRETVRKLARSLSLIGRTEEDRMEALAQGIGEMAEHMSKEIKRRENNPTDDLLSVMVEAAKNGVYSREEVVANATFVLFAGHETTINLICNSTLAFIRHPDQWETLRNDPSLVYKATEECLRYEAPVKRFQRLTTQDMEMRGKTLHKMDRVFAVPPSANRDPRKFPDPDRFDITRHPNPHIAFGGGVHHCLGVSLARMEGQEAFLALSQGFSRLYLETDLLEYQPSFSVRSLKSLPVRWN